MHKNVESSKTQDDTARKNNINKDTHRGRVYDDYKREDSLGTEVVLSSVVTLLIDT